MQTTFSLIKRNVKLFFKDKGMFFSSLITPIILLVLYVTFLAKVYKESFEGAIKEALDSGFVVENLDAVINATVGGQLVASLLAVCCVTVAFCSNLIMIQDKVTGARKDLLTSPLKKSSLAISYYVSSLFCTLIVTYVATAAGLVYIAATGWYLSFSDVLLIVLDVFLLTMFGVALSSVVNVFLSTNAQASAVGTIVSAGYGFICGAYMPISSFGTGLRNVLGFLPGTYGTALIKNHCLSGAFREMSSQNFPEDVITGIKESIDCNAFFFDTKVSDGAEYCVLIGSILILIGAFVLINVLRKKRG